MENMAYVHIVIGGILFLLGALLLLKKVNSKNMFLKVMLKIIGAILLTVGSFAMIGKGGASNFLTINTESNIQQEVSSPYDFELKDQYGNTQTLKQYYNKIVVLTFWASWCEPCREELPIIEELYKEYGENKGEVVFLGMARTANANANPQDISKEEIAAFLQQNQYTFPVAFDETGDLIKTYGIKAYPSVIIINKDRQIGGRVENKQSKEEIKAKIEEVRNQK